MRVAAATVIVVTIAAQAALAGTIPIQWPQASGGNDHYYQVVFKTDLNDPFLTWQEARSHAESLTYLGLQGHLATITTQAEDQFLLQNVLDTSLGSYWIGGQQVGGSLADASANWTWTTGEPWSFTHWLPGEPNDYQGFDETVLSYIFAASSTWGWEDNQATSNQHALIVEYEAAVVPLPDSMWLAIVTFAVIGILNLRRRLMGIGH